jgi:hypothetical protein
MKRKIINFLLITGIISSIYYIFIDIISSIIWKDYNFVNQTVSELFAINSPVRYFTIYMFTIYSLLIFIFSIGVYKLTNKYKLMKIAAILISIKELLGILATIIFPMHLRGFEGNFSDMFHGLLTAIGVFLCMFPAMILCSILLGLKFRIYSIITMILFVTFGILAGTMQPLLSNNLPTPFMGIFERINIYGYMFWIIVLSLNLISKNKFENITHTKQHNFT